MARGALRHVYPLGRLFRSCRASEWLAQGNLDECFVNYLMLQWLNTYPQALDYLANGRYYPIDGRDYFNSWPIFEEVRDNPTCGYPCGATAGRSP